MNRMSKGQCETYSNVSRARGASAEESAEGRDLRADTHAAGVARRNVHRGVLLDKCAVLEMVVSTVTKTVLTLASNPAALGAGTVAVTPTW